MKELRVGYGYDIHRFGEKSPLRLGGVEITGAEGLAGHSDADLLLHALADALLGAAGLGDIGEHFPDTDSRFRDAESSELARHLIGIVKNRGWSVVNTDLTIVAERPRLTAFKERIRRNVAGLLGVDSGRVNVKAKTKEKLGPVGEGRAMEAHVVVLIEREEP